ncbi:G2E3 ligase, partial [Grallaria varia]|nr:G2E3 ligase [Grallaria varia]
QCCFICGRSGATITSCYETDCGLIFHLPCAKEAGLSHSTLHHTEQAVEMTPEPDTKCLICLEPVEDRKTFNTLVCPVCKTAWFHRDCIQAGGQALHTGVLSLQCPLCRNKQEFLVDMFLMGIRVPFR